MQGSIKDRVAIAGMGCTLLGGVGDLLHSFEIGIPPLGIIGNILFASLATVAILKYHLLDIHIVLRKGLAYTLVSGVLVGLYVLIVFLIIFNLFREEDLLIV